MCVCLLSMLLLETVLCACGPCCYWKPCHLTRRWRPRWRAACNGPADSRPRQRGPSLGKPLSPHTSQQLARGLHVPTNPSGWPPILRGTRGAAHLLRHRYPVIHVAHAWLQSDGTVLNATCRAMDAISPPQCQQAFRTVTPFAAANACTHCRHKDTLPKALSLPASSHAPTRTTNLTWHPPRHPGLCWHPSDPTTGNVQETRPYTNPFIGILPP
jgi:hypothetical protein